MIANELENLGYKTKYGSSRWVQSTVIGIIKNEKYKGDLLLGKTFTVDTISKRRLEKFGEEDKFYIRDHHEAIISEEIFEEAQKILAKRNVNRGVHQEGQKRNKFSRWTIVNKKDTIFKYIFWERIDYLPIPECCFHFIRCQIA